MFRLSYSFLARAIKNCGQDTFYDIALLYLQAIGYKNPYITDGRNDGGTDIKSDNRRSTSVQLSIQKNWKSKINEDAEKIRRNQPNIEHMLYLTNRDISETDISNFMMKEFINKESISLDITDVKKIASILSNSNYVNRVYDLLNLKKQPNVSSSLEDIAISSFLLFSNETREFKKELVSTFIKSSIFINKNNCTLDDIVEYLDSKRLFDDSNFIKSRINHLKIKKEIIEDNGYLSLNEDEYEKIRINETNLQLNYQSDFNSLKDLNFLNDKQISELLDVKININTDIALEYKQFLDNHKISKEDSDNLLQLLPSLNTIKRKLFFRMIERIFKLNKYDISRALGSHSEITILLDANVAIPVLFGLMFQSKNELHKESKFAIATKSLLEICESLNLPLIIPDVYINEIASHGYKALNEYADNITLLRENNMEFVYKGAKNAFVHHYAHLEFKNNTFIDFLKLFGIENGKSKKQIESDIKATFELAANNLISIIKTPVEFDEDVYEELRRLRKLEAEILLKHDARVAKLVTEDNSKGYIVATWNNDFIDLLSNEAKVYADIPARIRDFLLFTNNEQRVQEISKELQSELSILYTDNLSRLSEHLTEQLMKLSQEEMCKLIPIIRDLKKQNIVEIEAELQSFLKIEGINTSIEKNSENYELD